MKHRGALFLFMVLALTTTGCITADVDLTECLRACDDDFELCVAAAEECFVGIEHWPGLATCVSRALDCIETQVDCITECAFEAESELS